MSARPPTSVEAREFEIKRGSPVTVVHGRRFSADDTVIEYAELVARANTRMVYRYGYAPLARASPDGRPELGLPHRPARHQGIC